MYIAKEISNIYPYNFTTICFYIIAVIRCMSYDFLIKALNRHLKEYDFINGYNYIGVNDIFFKKTAKICANVSFRRK